MIYFDNAATTRVCPEAAQVMAHMLTEAYGNPSSTHALGREARKGLEAARGYVAAAIGADKEEIAFTSGGTEADNWAVTGACRLMRHSCRHLIISAYEHDAMLQSAKEMEAQGWEVTRLQPDATGHITPAMVQEALRQDTALVSVMLVNNEIGAVNDLAAISALVHRSSKALVHTDAVQGLFKVPLSVKKLGVDLMSLSGHKIHGPKGSGALYIKKGIRLPALLQGGGQEGGRRSGTEAMPAICGFGEACRVGKAALNESLPHMKQLRQYMADTICSRLPDAVVLGPGEAPHILSLSLPGYKSEVLLNLLDAEGICVSKGSACKKGKRSHVLEVMGYDPKVIDGTLRISLSRYSTEAEAEEFCEKLIAAAGKILRVK